MAAVDDLAKELKDIKGCDIDEMALEKEPAVDNLAKELIEGAYNAARTILKAENRWPEPAKKGEAKSKKVVKGREEGRAQEARTPPPGGEPVAP